MPSSDPAGRLRDILENIDRIERYTDGMTLAAFTADERTADAVERCLARISEAAVKLGDEAQALCPGIPWRDVRGLGNRLRHEYSGVDLVRLWLLVESDLAPLQAACRDGLRRLGGDQP